MVSRVSGTLLHMATTATNMDCKEATTTNQITGRMILTNTHAREKRGGLFVIIEDLYPDVFRTADDDVGRVGEDHLKDNNSRNCQAHCNCPNEHRCVRI